MKKKRTVLIAIAIAVVASLLLFVVLSVADQPEDLTVEIMDFPRVKSGNISSITLAVTNYFYFRSQRIAAIEIEQASISYRTSLSSNVTLASHDGKHIEVLRPKNRGRWRVCVWVCPTWRERLDNYFTRKLQMRFLWPTYHGTYSDWIDD